jgi:glycosyltransferase involved in cell wall biosynthesis
VITNDEIKNDFVELLNSDQVFSVGELFPYNIFSRFIAKFKVFNLYKYKLDSCITNVIEFISKNNISIVHANLGLDLYLLGKLKYKMPEKIYAIYTMHGSLGLDPADSYCTFFSKDILLYNLNLMDKIISACDYFFNVLKKNKISLNDEAEIIENGIDKKNIAEYLSSKEINNNIEIVYLGGERHLKGPDILLKAMYEIVNKYKINNVKLNVLRDISHKSNFRKLVDELGLAPYISYIGYIPSPRHLKYLNDSDIFVLPSRTEGIANTLMEAIGLEKPIVATAVGGTPELLHDGKNGLLSSTDPNDLAEKMATVISDINLRIKFSEYNKNIKHAYFWSNIVKKYETLYLSAGFK